jgi:hypothetical protein
MTMQALGLGGGMSETCTACKRPFERGATMYAIEADDGTPLGWICQGCRDDWKKNGNKSKTAKVLAGGEA